MISDGPVFESRKYRRLFEPQEDERLRCLVDKFGAQDWVWIASHMPHRTARQCRERYKTYLCPEVNVTPWTEEEDRLLLSKYAANGSKWADFRPFFEKRTVNNIKNRWHTLTRRSLFEGEKLSKDANPLAVFQVEHLLNSSGVCSTARNL
jgi:hypothetical protein